MKRTIAVPALAMVAFAPNGSAVAPSVVFVGPLIAMWLDDRRQIVAHLALASVVLFSPSLLGLADGSTEAPLGPDQLPVDEPLAGKMVST